MKLVEQLVLIGPNRRCPNTIIELWLEASPEDGRVLELAGEGLRRKVVGKLAQHGVEPQPDDPLWAQLTGAPVEIYARLIGAIALALQRHAGHRVHFLGLYPSSEQNHCCVAIEYEQSDTGAQACRLAAKLVAELSPQLALRDTREDDQQGFTSDFEQFMVDAPGWVLPIDAQAVIDAARRLDVPCVKLDRDPYEGVSGDFRIRPNGMLKLGHACHQRVVDGTFPIDSGDALAALVHDREMADRVLESLDLPLAGRDFRAGVCVSPRHAVRAAERIGYPVRLKARSIARPACGVSAALSLESPAAVRAAAEKILSTSRGLIVEGWVPGRSYKVIVANQAVVAVIELEHGVGVADVTAGAHHSILENARRAARALKVGLMALTVVCSDIGRALHECGAVVGLDVAPELDRFLQDGAPFPARAILDRAAEGLVRHLFPAGAESRIPLVAVTGTNGKTTVCALIERIMRGAGFCTGRAGTTGLYLDGECLDTADLAGGAGHHRVLESSIVQFGILETARGAVTGMGLMFDRCDVAVCTNVTADHLGQRGIESVAQMAELKGWIMRRAHGAVVLNADNSFSVGMLSLRGGRGAWLVSAESPAGQLWDTYGEDVDLCTAEARQGVEWVNLRVAGRKVPVMPVDEIPITYSGTVRYNVSNVLQAVAACYQFGVKVEVIRQALSQFMPTFEDSPGRLNFYHGLPFRVLMDFAHNEEGYRQLVKFVDTLEVEGRKVLVLAGYGNWSDQENMDLAAIVANHFDVFICRNYPNLYGRQPEEIPAVMKLGLVEKGVPEPNVVETPGRVTEAVDIALRACRPQDLLVVCASNLGLVDEWNTITAFGSTHAGKDGA